MPQRPARNGQLAKTAWAVHIPPVTCDGVSAAKIDCTWVREVHGMCFQPCCQLLCRTVAQKPIDVCKDVLR
jgi:hypothetical protein